MRRDVATLLLASALYGFSIGCVHSARFGLHNLIKFPLLFLITGAACAVAYFLFACLVGGFRFRFLDIQRLAMRLYRDAALLLAALAPANLFLAWTIVPPDQTSLHEYPLFLGLNVGFIAAAGALALIQQVRAVVAGGWPGRLDAASVLRRPQHLRRRDAVLHRLDARLPRRHQLLRGRPQRRPAGAVRARLQPARPRLGVISFRRRTAPRTPAAACTRAGRS